MFNTFILLFLLNAELLAPEIPRVHDITNGKDLADMLLNRGVVLIHEKSDPDAPQFISCGVIVNASQEVVWGVLTDFERYHEFMPQTEKVRIKSRNKNTLAVEYNLNFKFTVIKLNIHYVLTTVLNPPSDIWWSIKKDEKNDISESTGRWELIPHGKDKTIVFYTIYTDLKSSGKIMGFFLNQQPHLGLAIQVSTAALVVESVKKRAEDISLASQKSP